MKQPELIEWIMERRSIRIYRPGPVDDAAVRRLLEVAMAAPSAVARDPWRFIVVRQRAGLEHLAATLSNGAMLLQAGLGIIVAGELASAHDGQMSYLLQDCAAAIENLLLGAHAMGLGACWLGIHPREQRQQVVRELLALPDGVIPVACIAIGHPAETKEPRTRYRDEYVHHERW